MVSILGTQPFSPKRDFWKRQFSDSATKAQLVFDVIFGIVMPILCFYFDPGIISSGPYTSDRLLSGYAISFYMFSGVAILGLMFWLGLRNQANRYAALIGGLFVSAATLSFIIGILMLPLTLIGLFFIIGVLGFTPFATGLVFLRHGLRAINQAKLISTGKKPTIMIATAAVLSVCFPLVTVRQLGRAANRSVGEIVSHKTINESDVNTVKHLRWFAKTNPIVRAYSEEKDLDRKFRLAGVYREITGKDIEQQPRIYRD